MNDKFFWILGPALFSVIGMVSAYLSDPRTTVMGTFLGGLIGFGLTVFALAGEGKKK